jgi:leucyl-tRNA synthetase
MINKYDPKSIEPKWQKYWEDNKTFAATEDNTKEKFFGLIEFPYPSGAGLHVGHPRPFTAMDVITRKKRMEGKSVLFPIGFDAFGLPTENYAIKTGRPPAEVTAENIANFTRQLKMLGYGFDWDRAVDTTDPKYYKWTQWIFLQLYKQGLAYKKNMPINWCLKCKIGLANEEVVDGKCERCGGDVEKRDKEQWMLAITKYADKLLNGLDTVDYIPQAKTQQQNWIGRSEGAEINFELYFTKNLAANDNRGPNGEKAQLTVFTTRPDTLFGATYMVLAPEHPWVTLATDDTHDVLENKAEVLDYVNATKKKTDLERSAEGREKTGVELKGVKAINPVNGEQIPLFIADYVLGGYGTGAIMAVPAHDERDFEFAKKYNLVVKQVVAPHIVLTGDCTPREEKETSRKDVVSAIVRNKKTNEYLVLNWENKRFGFIGGGIESGETYEEAVKRELIEETGYTSFEIVREVIPYLYGHGYKPRKDINCFDLDKVFLIDILDTEKQEDNENVAGEHSLKWLEEKEMSAVLTLDHHKFIWNWFVNNEECFSDEGIAINSSFLNGLSTTEAKEKMIQHLEEKNIGKRKVQFKLRDWVFSRQRYWGEPIPLVYCEHCAKTDSSQNPGWIPLPEDQLPLELPKVEKYQPTDTGESPLSVMTDWVSTTCPQCGGAARRETDTMPNWAGSSWYFISYAMRKEQEEYVWDRKTIDYWMKDGIDWYNGGMEHTVLHLLYSRFWNQFLFDIGAVPVSEPYKKRTSHGMILASDGLKMSKSLGNVINPDEMVEKFGTDAFRAYIMFMGPFDQAVAWDTNGVIGVRRFLDRVYGLQEKVQSGVVMDSKVIAVLHQTIKAVSDGIESMRFNVAVAKMMECSNELLKQESIDQEVFESFLKLLSPFAPHLAEELWSQLGHGGSIATASWPVYDASLVVTGEMTVVAQVNGKVRDEFVVSPDISEEEIKALVLGSEKVQKWLEGKEPKKVIYVTGKLVSIVV